MLKKKKAQTVKSKAGTPKIETSASKRSEFTKAALEASAKVGAPVGGLIVQACEAAHAGAPAAPKLRPIWKRALWKRKPCLCGFRKSVYGVGPAVGTWLRHCTACMTTTNCQSMTKTLQTWLPSCRRWTSTLEPFRNQTNVTILFLPTAWAEEGQRWRLQKRRLSHHREEVPETVEESCSKFVGA